MSDVVLNAHTGNTINRGGERDIKEGTLSAPHLSKMTTLVDCDKLYISNAMPGATTKKHTKRYTKK